MIYELLAGTKLFASEAQVSRYYFGKWPFPEDRLKALSPPTHDVGILLLKSMLVIEPEDRPTAAGALGYQWLAGPKSSIQGSGDDQDEVTQSRDENTRSPPSTDELATDDRPRKRHCESNPIRQGSTRCIPRDVATGVNPGLLKSGEPVTPSTVSDTLDVASAESSLGQPSFRMSEITHHYSQPTRSNSSKVARKKQIGNFPQTCLPGGIRMSISVHVGLGANRN